MSTSMNFTLPPELTHYLQRLDAFIAAEITPLQHTANNNRFFDHRREFARTDPATGLPVPEWTALLAAAVRRADATGFWRLSLPHAHGGASPRDVNLWMAAVRMHLSRKGLGLFNDLQTEHSVVGNFPLVAMVREWGREDQKEELIRGMLEGGVRVAFGLTEPGHGSDAAGLETCARKVEGGWRVSGRKMWTTGMDRATCVFVFARTEQEGVSCFVMPVDAEGLKVESFEWTFNMPSDHATISLDDVFVPHSALLGPLGHGLRVASTFLHENRIRQAASSLGAAQYCISESITYSLRRRPFGRALATNQAIQFPLVELHTQATALRLLILETAHEMDNGEVDERVGAKVSMCNYWANRLVCEAADRAMQVHGGWGYSRHYPFEHIYRHHRRYRITEGSEEIQMRRVGRWVFGFGRGREREAKL